MLTKYNKKILVLASIGVWVAIWALVSNYVDASFIFPTPKETFDVFFALLGTANFYKTVFMSIGRILIGLISGIVFGFALGVASHYFSVLYYFFSPLVSIVRATPVASVIIILWFFISKDSLPIIISYLMVSPIIWQSTVDAMNNRDIALYEVADVFELSLRKRFKHLILPQLSKYLVPAITTSTGLAWKSGIAAEIITHAKNSIGREISNAKNLFLGSEMFAWTIAVILLSILFESTLKIIMRKASRYDVKD